MNYRVLFILLFLVTFYNIKLFANEVVNNINYTKPSTQYIKVSLDSSVLPNSALGRKINLIVQEDVYNNSSTAVLIPVYTTITCRQEGSKHVDNKYDIIYATCDKMFLSNGNKIEFKGRIYSGIDKEGILTEKNVTIPKNTRVLIRIESALNIIKENQ